MTMAKTRLILCTAATAFALALPSVGGAQNAPIGGGDAPIMWGGDRVQYSAEGFALIGRAEILQGDNRLRAERIDFKGTEADVREAEAVGGVFFVTPQQTVRGDRAHYNLANGDLTVTGQVVLNQGRNVATGGRLIYNVRSGDARWEGAGSNGRVQGVFYPNGN